MTPAAQMRRAEAAQCTHAGWQPQSQLPADAHQHLLHGPALPTGLPCPLPCAVGFCILLAQPLAWALRPLLLGQPANGGAGAGTTQRGARRAQAAGALLGLLLCFYAVRTVVRNREWHNNETLFRAAEKVTCYWCCCPCCCWPACSRVPVLPAWCLADPRA